MDTKVYYFSGTGNTLAAAKKIAEALKGQLVSIADEVENGTKAISADRLIFLYPAYAYEMPAMVSRFLKSAEINARYIAALVTYGTDAGGALSEAKRILKKKGLTLNYAGLIPSVENYVPIFGERNEAIRRNRTLLQEHSTANITVDLENERTNSVRSYRPLSMLVSGIFRVARPFLQKMHKVNSDCNRCGICERVCPANAVRVTDSGPIFDSKCEQCQACINFCPKNAINCLRVKPKVLRYKHKDIKVSDMLRKEKGDA